MLLREYHFLGINITSLLTLLTKKISRQVTVTESFTGTSTVSQTVPTTTTFLLACTNSDIHRAEDMCGGGDGSAPMPVFSFEAPTTPGGTKKEMMKEIINQTH